MERKKYKEIYNDIINNIQAQKLLPGDKLPTEEQLMETYNVSRTTIRKALKLLENANLIYRIKKAGTFLNGKTNRNSASKIIPFIFPKNDDTIKVINVMQTFALLNNCFVPMHDSKNNPEEERKILLSFLNTNINALLIYSCSKQKNIDLLSEFIIKKIPVIFIDRSYFGLDSPLVSSDNKRGMYALVSRLISMGHKRIAYFAISDIMFTSESNRFTGYCSALIDKGIPLRKEYIFRQSTFDERDTTTEQQNSFTLSCINAVNNIINMTERPSVICCNNDNSARTIINLLAEQGIRCPEDISVTGFDDSPLATSEYPCITTVAQSFDKIGEAAINVAINILKNQPVTTITNVETKIIERDTVSVLNT